MIDLNNIKQVHCIGIGGVGLSAIADLLLARGCVVTGSDMNQNDKTERLIREGAVVYLGHRAKNVEGADLVVYTVAVGADNPEMARAKELGIQCVTRAEMLGELMKECRNSIAISGTHGKTTTTSMVSLILNAAGKDPTILVGGNLEEIGGNVRVGHSDYFVTEACEYRDSFLQLKPRIEIILNIDSDHLDYFKDIEHIVDSFGRFTRLVPEDGMIIAYDANPFVKKVTKGLSNVITFGFSDSCTYYVEDIEFNKRGRPSFCIFKQGKKLCCMQLKIPGEHNILNALVATAACYEMGVGVDTIVDTLESYKGTQRRFDEIGETQNGMKLVDDYAHHPTEIKATLKAALNTPHKDIWVIFQPHTYTRTLALFDEFPGAFENADKVVLAEIFAAREKNVHNISSKALVSEIKKKYPEKDAYYFADFEEIANFVYNNAEPGDLIMTMGAGDVYKIGEMILEKDGTVRGGKVK